MIRPKGPGLYCTINLGAHRREDLSSTHRDSNPLLAIPDPQNVGEAIMRRARNLGPGPREAVRQLIDQDARKVAARLAELEEHR